MVFSPCPGKVILRKIPRGGNPLKIVDLLLTPNSVRPGGNRPGHPLVPKGITVHREGNRSVGSTARANAAYFDTIRPPGHRSSAHYIVDEDEIVRCIPENEIAWHAGAAANSTTIGIELCEPLEPQGYRHFIWLVTDICRRRGFLSSPEFIRPHSYYNPTDRPFCPWSWQRFVAGAPDPNALYDPDAFYADVAAALRGSAWRELAAVPVPRLVEGRLMVPLHVVSQALGGTLSWEPATRSAMMRLPNGSATIFAVDDSKVLARPAQPS